MLEKIISGGQNGADVAGVIAAKEKGLQTGGTMPLGYRTLDGSCAEYASFYGMTEHSSPYYPGRTFQNAKDADATIRIAHKLDSSGEKLTLKAITQYKKPHFDVWVRDTSVHTTLETQTPAVLAKWLIENKIRVLNVAGNSEQTAPGIQHFAYRYVCAVIDEVRKLQAAT